MPAHSLKAVFAAAFVFSLLLAGVRADDAHPEQCVVNHDKFSEHHHPPITVSYKGQSMVVCCRKCARKFKKDPEKFLKLYEQAKADMAKSAGAAHADAALPKTAKAGKASGAAQ